MYVPCDVCHGKRYNRETLEIRYRGRNISEVLDLTVEQALEYFESVPAIARKLHTLIDVGLSYIRLGQSLSLIHISSWCARCGRRWTKATCARTPIPSNWCSRSTA